MPLRGQGESMTARRCFLKLQYENKDISADLAPYLKSWGYTDNMSGSIDDLQITLEDREQMWIADWFPTMGAKLKAEIMRENWNGRNKQESVILGTFEIDEIEIGDPPKEVTIKALAVPESASMRGEKKNRAWEKTKLSVIAKDLAEKAQLKLTMDTEENPEYDRMEQVEQSDLQFLQKTCMDEGLALKITNNQMVIFDEYKYEQQKPVMTIDRKEIALKNFKGKATLNHIYAAARVVYKDPNKKIRVQYHYAPPPDPPGKKKRKRKKTVRYRTKNKEEVYTYRIPNAPATGKTLVVRERVSSFKEAERKCKKALREKNSQAWQMNMTFPMRLNLFASNTVILENFGDFDGKYIATQVALRQGSGTEMSLEMRRCLEEY